ncbi:MAG: hypothetical protein IKJ45_02170 [Kiritimatiellae bacterium]|nr:hypothetical protein [Kiritimatiellia bacterium]
MDVAMGTDPPVDVEKLNDLPLKLEIAIVTPAINADMLVALESSIHVTPSNSPTICILCGKATNLRNASRIASSSNPYALIKATAHIPLLFKIGLSK